MKKLFFPLVALPVLFCTNTNVNAQKFKEQIHKEFSLPQAAVKSMFALYNTFGAVKVEGYSGDKVMIDVYKTITAENTENLEKGKREVKLFFDQIADTIMIYTTNPYDSRPHSHSSHRNNDRDTKRNKLEYKYELEFTVKVPFNINLDVSTITNGDVTIKDVGGSLKIGNVNGNITIANAKGTTHVSTVNGNLTVNYLKNPVEACTYHTMNGKLKVTYQPDLSADLEFKSMNGAFYTDFPNTETLPAEITKTQQKKSDGTLYKINKNTSIRIGNGGNIFKFTTLNGDIYVQKKY